MPRAQQSFPDDGIKSAGYHQLSFLVVHLFSMHQLNDSALRFSDQHVISVKWSGWLIPAVVQIS